jgi:hypothetical protein
MQESYKDAEDISDGAGLLRRITPSLHTNILSDGTRILTGFAFREQSHEFSMYVAAEITYEKLLSCGMPTQEIIELLAGDLRQLGYIIIREPDECDPSHVFAKSIQYKSRGQVAKDCKKLAEIVNQRTAARKSPKLY